ncbi:hypothetical protein Hanom_Chr05g00459031 [Helianthus anomalus]
MEVAMMVVAAAMSGGYGDGSFLLSCSITLGVTVVSSPNKSATTSLMFGLCSGSGWQQLNPSFKTASISSTSYSPLILLSASSTSFPSTYFSLTKSTKIISSSLSCHVSIGFRPHATSNTTTPKL